MINPPYFLTQKSRHFSTSTKSELTLAMEGSPALRGWSLSTSGACSACIGREGETESTCTCLQQRRSVLARGLFTLTCFICPVLSVTDRFSPSPSASLNSVTCGRRIGNQPFACPSPPQHSWLRWLRLHSYYHALRICSSSR